jgi:hypothetical protein
MNSQLFYSLIASILILGACASDSSKKDQVETSKEIKALTVEIDEIVKLKDSLDRVKNRISSSTEKPDPITTIKIREFETYAAKIEGDFKFYQASKSKLEQGLITQEEYEDYTAQIAQSMKEYLEKIKIINKAYFDPNPLD